jgi:hypothetical protein
MCETLALPIGSGDAPRLLEAKLECAGSGINAMLTVDDPQGSRDLNNVPQEYVLFQRRDCSVSDLPMTDDIAVAGKSESFGEAVNRRDQQQLYLEICGYDQWPVKVLLRDMSGHETGGVVAARITFTL